jgi:hypothetical protein
MIFVTTTERVHKQRAIVIVLVCVLNVQTTTDAGSLVVLILT